MGSWQQLVAYCPIFTKHILGKIYFSKSMEMNQDIKRQNFDNK